MSDDIDLGVLPREQSAAISDLISEVRDERDDDDERLSPAFDLSWDGDGEVGDVGVRVEMTSRPGGPQVRAWVVAADGTVEED